MSTTKFFELSLHSALTDLHENLQRDNHTASAELRSRIDELTKSEAHSAEEIQHCRTEIEDLHNQIENLEKQQYQKADKVLDDLYDHLQLKIDQLEQQLGHRFLKMQRMS